MINDLPRWKAEITDRVNEVLSRVPENTIYEQHFARTVESYLRSLETIENMERKENYGNSGIDNWGQRSGEVVCAEELQTE